MWAHTNMYVLVLKTSSEKHRIGTETVIMDFYVQASNSRKEKWFNTQQM